VPYTSLEKLTGRFGDAMLISLTDRGEVHTDTIDTAVVDQAIEETGSIIDGYVGVRYALPMADIPPLIATLAVDIAIYKLHVYSPDPKIEADYKAAMMSLKHISDGSVRLPVAGKETPGSGSSGARVTDRTRTFTEDGMKGFIG
jgi:phage gp36-like protein